MMEAAARALGKASQASMMEASQQVRAAARLRPPFGILPVRRASAGLSLSLAACAALAAAGMPMHDPSQLARDQFYEAAIIAELMPCALDGIARLAGCESSVLIASDGRADPVWQANAKGYPATERFVRDGWAPRNIQAARTFARSGPRFFSDHDLFTEEEIEREPFYREFLRPNGLAWGCGTVVRGATENQIIISVFRPYEHGPLTEQQVRRLDEVRPSLARAAFLASRLGLEKARAAVTTLETIGLPAAALSRTGRIRVANGRFEELIPKVFLDGTERVRLAVSEADSLLAEALAGQPISGSAGISIPMVCNDQTRTILHLIPIVGQAHDIFSSVEWLLVGTVIAPATMPDAAILQALFDLSPAESRVVKQIGDGATVNEIANNSRHSPETIRKQLKAVMAKIGVNRQSELIRLLGAARLFPPAET